jgi:hypothetical protein
VAEAQNRLRSDPDFRPAYRQLFDFRAAVPTDIGTDQVYALLDSNPFDVTARRAYGVSPRVGVGMGRVAQAVAEFRNLPLKIFEDMDAARRWLLDDGQLAAPWRHFAPSSPSFFVALALVGSSSRDRR